MLIKNLKIKREFAAILEIFILIVSIFAFAYLFGDEFRLVSASPAPCSVSNTDKRCIGGQLNHCCGVQFDLYNPTLVCNGILTCPSGQTCNEKKIGGAGCESSSSSSNCIPACSGKTCGDDSCGGSCGTCSIGTCVNGNCVQSSSGSNTPGSVCSSLYNGICMTEYDCTTNPNPNKQLLAEIDCPTGKKCCAYILNNPPVTNNGGNNNNNNNQQSNNKNPDLLSSITTLTGGTGYQQYLNL